MDKSFPYKRAVLHLLLYSLDVGFALTSFVYGFGLSVQNWWIVLAVGIVTRWIFHVAQSAFFWQMAREEAAKGTT